MGSPAASSSSSLRTLSSLLFSWGEFLPSSTGTTVKFVGIFTACASQQARLLLLICHSLSVSLAPSYSVCFIFFFFFLLQEATLSRPMCWLIWAKYSVSLRVLGYRQPMWPAFWQIWSSHAQLSTHTRTNTHSLVFFSAEAGISKDRQEPERAEFKRMYWLS